MGGVCVSQQLPPEEGGLKEKQDSKKMATLKRVQHGVQKKIIRPLSPKISRKHHPKPVTNEDDALTSHMTKEIDTVPSLEDDMIPPPEYTPRMTDAAGVCDDDHDDVLFNDIVAEPDPSIEYTELICDNLGPLRDACNCNESHCFICRKRGADNRLEKSGKCVIWIEDDSEYKSGKDRDLQEGDSVKPCCLCFSIEM